MLDPLRQAQTAHHTDQNYKLPDEHNWGDLGDESTPQQDRKCLRRLRQLQGGAESQGYAEQDQQVEETFFKSISSREWRARFYRRQDL